MEELQLRGGGRAAAGGARSTVRRREEWRGEENLTLARARFGFLPASPFIPIHAGSPMAVPRALSPFRAVPRA